MKKRSILFLIIALITVLVLFAFSSCDGEESPDSGNGDDQQHTQPTESIVLDKTELSLQLGTSHTLTVSGIPEEHSGKALQWSSDNPSAVMVGSDGKVSAIAVGKATVTVTVKGTSLKAECEVTVTPISVSGIVLSKTSADLTVGQSSTLIATVSPSNATDKRVKWESSDATVVKVVNGSLTALKSGSAVITATAMDGSGVSATCTVTVKSLTVSNVRLDKTRLDMDSGDTVKLTATVYPAGAENGEVSWKSSDPSVISVDKNGNVTALKVGSATVTATAGGISASCNVSAVKASISYTRRVDKTTVVVDASETKKDGVDVIFWQANAGKRIELGGKRNFSGNDVLTFKVYSENATGSEVQIRFSYADDDKSGTTMAPYYRVNFTVDFTGWKEFTLDINDVKFNYSPTWTRISYVSFDCSGWGMTPNANTRLYFSDIKMQKYAYDVQVSGSKTEAQYLSDITSAWREMYTGNGGTSSAYRTRIATIESNAVKWWKTNSKSYTNTFKGTGTDKKGTLFGIAPGMDWNGAAALSDLYWRIQAMSLGYTTMGTSTYKDPALLTAIRNSLEYMYNNYYGEQHITDISYINWVKNSNWWYWEIGISSYVADILMILSDDLTQAEINKYLIPVDYFIPEITMTACNRLWVGKVYFASAILQGKTADALVALEKLYEIFDYVTYGDGFYTDGSFIQHNHHPYTGGYGASLFEELTDFMLVLESTVFTIPYEVAKAHYDWVFDSFEPVIYKKNLMASVNGREVVRSTTTENTRFVKFLVSLIRMAKYAPENERDRIIPLLKYYIENSDVSSYIGAVPINLIDFVYQIREDTSIEARSDYEIFKVFGNMDRVVQHRPDYSVAFALSSTRVFKYEAINNENVKGWYQGDGMVYIYTDGYDFSNAFYNYADPYKMPGTTVSAETRNEDNMNGGPALGVLGTSAFSGGVECGKYGVAAMILGYEENPYYNTDITARKSYFAFDNEIICIGSGIKESTTGKEIFTTVENRFWNSGDVFKVDGAVKSGSGSAKAKYMHFTNMGGYVFDGVTEVRYAKYVNTHSFLEITLSHGVSPTNGSYFFIYLPTATDAETRAYSESLSERITVISQTDTVHAVKDNDIGVTGYVFYEAGSCNGVTVSAPCIVMVSEDSISVSDPTHNLSSVTVTVDGSALTFVTADLCGATVTKSR